VVKKPVEFCELKTRKQKRQATISIQELTRDYLQVCQQNQIKYKYVLADSWFSSKENMIWIHQHLKKHFMMALKSNRTDESFCFAKSYLHTSFETRYV
jgi:hypothetical protein